MTVVDALLADGDATKEAAKVLAGVLRVIAFIVPGFIIERTYSVFVDRRRTSGADLVLESTTYACAYYGLVIVPIYWVLLRPLSFVLFLPPVAEWSSFALSLVVPTVVLLGPVLAGLAWARLEVRGWIDDLGQRLGLRVSRPTAWDEAFSAFARTAEARWALVTLSDGRKVAGEWSSRHSPGSTSYIGLTPHDHDLFLWRTFHVDADGNIGDVYSPVRGIWIKADEIRTVELIALSDEVRAAAARGASDAVP